MLSLKVFDYDLIDLAGYFVIDSMPYIWEKAIINLKPFQR